MNEPSPPAEAGPSSLGLGLPNARERLALLYGEDWRLDQSRGDGRFVIEVEIPLSRMPEPRRAPSAPPAPAKTAQP